MRGAGGNDQRVPRPLDDNLVRRSSSVIISDIVTRSAPVPAPARHTRSAPESEEARAATRPGGRSPGHDSNDSIIKYIGHFDLVVPGALGVTLEEPVLGVGREDGPHLVTLHHHIIISIILNTITIIMML